MEFPALGPALSECSATLSHTAPNHAHTHTHTVHVHADTYTLDISALVGPSYTLNDLFPRMGPVTGGTELELTGLDFVNTAGNTQIVKLIFCSDHPPLPPPPPPPSRSTHLHHHHHHQHTYVRHAPPKTCSCGSSGRIRTGAQRSILTFKGGSSHRWVRGRVCHTSPANAPHPPTSLHNS